MSDWTADDMPNLEGRVAVVTGANSGLGFEAARMLAEHGAHVVMACRDVQRGEAAAERIKGSVAVQRLDLASLASIREAAGHIRELHRRLDLLVNNAGVMVPPYTRTEDGFELQFGVNHLGHFALTGLVLDRLLAAPGSRIVTVSSNGHRLGRIAFDDLQSERRYRRVAAYAQSKLANLLFTFELQRRLAAAGASTSALAAHPGTASTELERHVSWWMRLPGLIVPRHAVATAALPTLRAATDPVARGGEYYGPGGRGGFTGHPVRVEPHPRAYDTEVQRRLWEESERLTGVGYVLDPARS
jgi:NAD(P)-dependent dehydrogenase (short-subunit alcohol dehydrogenase family)